MKYDIAGKVLIEKCREALLTYFLGIDVAHSVVLERTTPGNSFCKRMAKKFCFRLKS
ncbi:MAG: hypothetical protein HY881_15500 [Deltaproteobacteria bacterium]|nr:hypothetical protein [Deltaproteobacteria bacterium]